MRFIAGLAAVALLVVQAGCAEDMAVERDLPGAEVEYRELLAEAPNDPSLNYNLGTVLLLEGEYDEARTYLTRASDGDTDLRAIAAFNLGNSDLVPAYADSALAERSTRLRRAIGAYQVTLRADPSDVDARWNLELARRLLEGPPPTSSAAGGGSQGAGGNAQLDVGSPNASPASSGAESGQMTPAEAEALLGAARIEELEVQRGTLRKARPSGPILP